jgi:hypothetical protein
VQSLVAHVVAGAHVGAHPLGVHVVAKPMVPHDIMPGTSVERDGDCLVLQKKLPHIASPSLAKSQILSLSESRIETQQNKKSGLRRLQS